MADRKKMHEVKLEEGQTRSALLAKLAASTIHGNALPLMQFSSMGFGGMDEMEVEDMITELSGSAGSVRDGNLDSLTDMLTAQALVMDTMFTEFCRRAAVNMTEYPKAVDRYMGFAFKAQAQCRTTVEALARIKRGGKQTVKVVHVHEGGQAVVADEFNAGGDRGLFQSESKPAHEQQHSQGDGRPQVLGYDATGNGVPVSGDEGQEAVQTARRKGDGSA